MKKIKRIGDNGGNVVFVHESELDELESIIEEQQKKIDRECVWISNDPENDEYFETACKKAFCTIAGTLEENGFFYCPYCGGKIKVKEYEKD